MGYIVGIGVILGGRVGPEHHFLGWEDGPTRYKYIDSEILLGFHFSD